MNYLLEFQKFKNTRNLIIPDEIKTLLTNSIGWNEAIEEIVYICASLAYDVSNNMGANVSKLKNNKNENILTKIISNYWVKTKGLLGNGRF